MFSSFANAVTTFDDIYLGGLMTGWIRPQQIDNSIGDGDRARDARNWIAAARHYREALAQQPALMPIWVQLGHALKEQGDYVGAEAAYRRALTLDYSAADTHLQLGHLLKLQRRRARAIDAYATAVRLDPHLVSAREALHDALGYSPPEIARTLVANAPVESAKNTANSGSPPRLVDRYGARFADASRNTGTGPDVIWLGVMDWHYRIQRPQHMAAHLADRGARILYISLVFDAADGAARFRVIDAPHPGVFEIRLRIAGDPSATIYEGLSEIAVGELKLALSELNAALGIRAPVVLVEHPEWHDVACSVAGATIVYDCLDLATGFSNAAKSLAAAESHLLAAADLVVVASQPLGDRIVRRHPCTVIRNAADFDHFSQGFAHRPISGRPVIGYFGAIADWFNIGWIEACASARPHWDFRLIGRVESCDTSRAARLPNVRFYGEIPYRELPQLLRDFDVAMIPFVMNDLTICTNPVKLYEYMAAGKPVVASPMPEVIAATDLVYIADDASSFAVRIAQALAEDSPVLRVRRQEWAREQTWANRAQQLAQAINGARPESGDDSCVLSSKTANLGISY